MTRPLRAPRLEDANARSWDELHDLQRALRKQYPPDAIRKDWSSVGPITVATGAAFSPERAGSVCRAAAWLTDPDNTGAEVDIVVNGVVVTTIDFSTGFLADGNVLYDDADVDVQIGPLGTYWPDVTNAGSGSGILTVSVWMQP